MKLSTLTTSKRLTAFGRLSLTLGCLTLVFALSACTQSERKPLAALVKEETPVRAGLPQTALPMPPLDSVDATRAAWTLTDGRRTRLAEYKGKVVVLDFYATWCAPCREETPHLSSLQERFGASGLQVVGLNVGGDEDRSRVPDFVRSLGINYELAYPTPEAVALYMRDDPSIPQTLIFDRDGQLLRHLKGYDATVRRDLEQTIGEAIGGGSDR